MSGGFACSGSRSFCSQPPG